MAFTNLEVLPNDYRGDPALESGGSHFGATAWVLDKLQEAGFNLFATATNYCLDWRRVSSVMTGVAASDSAEFGVNTQVSACNQTLMPHPPANPWHALNKTGWSSAWLRDEPNTIP